MWRYFKVFCLIIGSFLLKAAWDDEMWVLGIISILLMGLYAFGTYKEILESIDTGTKRRVILKNGVSVILSLLYLFVCDDGEPVVLLLAFLLVPIVVEAVYYYLEKRDIDSTCPKCGKRGSLKSVSSNQIRAERIVETRDMYNG